MRHSVEVKLNGRPLRLLNQLEMIHRLLHANICGALYIVAIDRADGVVKKLVDLRDIVDTVDVDPTDAVLNGIAWDAKKPSDVRDRQAVAEPVQDRADRARGTGALGADLLFGRLAVGGIPLGFLERSPDRRIVWIAGRNSLRLR